MICFFVFCWKLEQHGNNFPKIAPRGPLDSPPTTTQRWHTNPKDIATEQLLWGDKYF